MSHRGEERDGQGEYLQSVQIGQTLLEVFVPEVVDLGEDVDLLFDLELQRVDRIGRQNALRNAGRLAAHLLAPLFVLAHTLTH